MIFAQIFLIFVYVSWFLVDIFPNPLLQVPSEAFAMEIHPPNQNPGHASDISGKDGGKKPNKTANKRILIKMFSSFIEILAKNSEKFL